ncbi:MAG: nucleotidyltransferase domain-containing protein [Myxococcota bacterium]
MFAHHAETIQRVTDHFANDGTVNGLLLAGSIAHGFATASSDVDILIIVSDEEQIRRSRGAQSCFFSRELCTYEGGYVDGKYVSEGFMREVAARGSEPARFAFRDARILFARSSGVSELLAQIARYPKEEKASRVWRFQAQFEAWHWYCDQALKQENLPLLRMAVAKLTLFGGRLVLAHNELLYPYHKWFLRVLAAAPEKPAQLLDQIELLAREPSRPAIDAFAASIRGFRPWQADQASWPAQFMQDSELTWLHGGGAPVDDI